MVFSGETGLYRTALSLNANGVNAIVAVESAQCAFVGGGDGHIKKIGGSDAEWKLFGEIAVEGSILGMAANGDGTQLIVTTTAGFMYRVLTADMTFTLAVESPLHGIQDVALCPARADVFATSSSDGIVRLWDLNDYSIASRFTLSPAARSGAMQGAAGVSPTCCAFECGDWKLLIVGFTDGRVRCVDVSQPAGQLVWAMPSGHKGRVHTVRACGLFIASAGDDSVVRIWQRGTNALVAQLQDHKMPTTAVLIDNTTPSILHSIGMDMTHHAYDLSKNSSNQNPRRIAVHSVANCGGFVCATQRLDAEHELIVGTADGRIFFFDLDVSQKPVLEVADRNRVRVSAVEASPDGRHLAAGLADGSILVYCLNGQSCNPVFFVQCHSGAVTRCAWTADSKQIVTSSSDGDLMVWNFFVAS
jgi:WD40 repeat protein